MENMVKKRILVTGSEGYIGSALIEVLLKKGYDIVGVDTGYYTSSKIKRKEKYVLIHDDIRSLSSSRLSAFDVIIHLAALSNDPTGELNSSVTKDINYEATVHLAKEAKRAGVKRFIFSSSCSVYGIAETGTVDETTQTHPLTAYAVSKVASEKALQGLSDKNFCVCLLRNATVYGFSTNFRNDLVVNNFVTCGFATKDIRILSDGTPWRPLIDVRDLAEIFSEFLIIDSKKVNGVIFNIGFNENNFQVRDILRYVQKALPDCSVTFTKEHGNDTRSYRVNFNRFHKTFPDIVQKWPIEKSIQDMISHLRKINFCEKDFREGTYTRIMTLRQLLKQGKIDNTFRWIV